MDIEGADKNVLVDKNVLKNLSLKHGSSNVATRRFSLSSALANLLSKELFISFFIVRTPES